MKQYVVHIEELLSKQVIVEAEDDEEAEEIAREMYRNEEIILYPEDCYQVNVMVSCEEDNLYTDWHEL